MEKIDFLFVFFDIKTTGYIIIIMKTSRSTSATSSVIDENVIYYGERGNEFKEFLFNLLVKSKLKRKYIDYLVDDESMETYHKAFTSDTADEENNYQLFEQLGDISANKFLVWYMHKRFPQLNCSQGVKIVARLRINYGAKQSFFSIAESLGFWKYISASEEQRNRCKKPLLEDTFEAFIGATEYLIDKKLREYVGYSVVSTILENIFNDINISLKYEDLYDAKTRLKELFDFYNQEIIGTVLYENEKNMDEKLNTTKVYQIVGDKKAIYDENNKIKYIPSGRPAKKMFLGEGTASLKTDAEQRAANMALETFKARGIVKIVPEFYSFISK